MSIKGEGLDAQKSYISGATTEPQCEQADFDADFDVQYD